MNHQEKVEEALLGETPFRRSTANQIILAVLANVPVCLGGMNVAITALTLPFLLNLTKDQTSWFASVGALAVLIGSLFSGSISDKFGRKPALFFVSVISLLGCLIHTAAYYCTAYQFCVLIIGRIISGLASGFRGGVPTVYLAEVSSPHLRGMFCAWQSMFAAIGVLLMYIFGLIVKDNWGLLGTISASLSLISAISIIFYVPETSMWLVGKHRYEEAKTNMCKIYGTKICVPEITNELESLKSKQNTQTKIKKSLAEQSLQKIRYLIKPNILKPLSLMMILFLFQSFSGMFVISSYTINICKNSGITIDPYLSTILIGIIGLIGTITSSFLTKILKRKRLITISGLGMTISMICLAGYLFITEKIRTVSNLVSLIPLMLLLFYVFISSIGIAIPFIINAEIFPTKIRGTASSLSIVASCFYNFLVTKIYLSMVDILGYHGVFLFQGLASLLSVLFVLWLIPETKDKTLIEIEEFYKSNKNTADTHS